MPSSKDWPICVNTPSFSFILPDDCNVRLLPYRDLLQTWAKPFLWAVHRKHDELPGCGWIFHQSKQSPPGLSFPVFTSVYLSFHYSFGTQATFTGLGLLDTADFITYPGLCTKAVCLFEAKQFMFSPWKKMEAHKWKGRRKQLTVATNLFWIPEQQEWREQAGRAAESLPGWPEEVVVHQITTQIPKGFRTSCTVIALLLHAPNLFTMWPHYVTFLMSPSERPLWQSIS